MIDFQLIYQTIHISISSYFILIYIDRFIGSAAGNSFLNYGDFMKYNGNAYDAKIAFFDIEKTGDTSLLIPSNLETDLFYQLYSIANAKIFSNSWGSSSDHTYSINSYQTDKFMYDNPDTLVLFAQGNSGPNSGTVASPATFKNGVSVGASLNDYQSWEAYTLYGTSTNDNLNVNSLAYFSSRGPTTDGRIKPDITAPGKLLCVITMTV